MFLEVTNWMLGYDFGRNFIFNKAKQQVMKASGGHYPAPLRILEIVKTSLAKGPEVGYKLESKVGTGSFHV